MKMYYILVKETVDKYPSAGAGFKITSYFEGNEKNYCWFDLLHTKNENIRIFCTKYNIKKVLALSISNSQGPKFTFDNLNKSMIFKLLFE